MILKNALLADHIVNLDNNKKAVLGVFNNIASFEYPMIHAKMFMYLDIIGDIDEEGKHEMEIHLLDGDFKKLGDFNTNEFELPKNLPELILPTLRTEVVVELNGFGVEHPGLYVFRILVDGNRLGEVPLTMIKLERANNNG